MNLIYCATSIDGYITDSEGNHDWLFSVPNPENIDMGWNALVERYDVVVMGRKTFDTVLGFSGEWPYKKPICVLSNSMKEVPEHVRDKAFVLQGDVRSVENELHARGYNNLYVDGGNVTQQFLQHDLLDEMIITMIPLVLGGGTPLFAAEHARQQWRLQSSTVFLDTIVQNHWVRVRE